MVGKFFASLPSLQAKRSVTKCSAAIPPYTSHCERNEVQRSAARQSLLTQVIASETECNEVQRGNPMNARSKPYFGIASSSFLPPRNDGF